MVDPQKIWSSSQLPTLPAVAVKLLETAKDPDSEIKDVVALIRTDPAISAKILKAANSSMFGLSTKVTSVERAVPLLGTTVSTSLALSFSLTEAAMTRGPTAEYYAAYWLQSIVHASAAERLATICEDGLGADYFLAGLLLDIGRLAMLKTVSPQYIPVLKTAHDEQRILVELEQEQLGTNHVEIGVQLMKNWSLPEMMLRAVQFHHATLERINVESDCLDFPLIRALAVSATVGDYFCSSAKGLALERLRNLTATFYEFDEERLQDLITQIKLRIDESADLFSINAAEVGDPSDLMAAANEQLSVLALKAHAEKTQGDARQKEMEQEKEVLQSQNEQLQKQAQHDALTGIYNRKYFDESLAQSVEHCCRSAVPLGVIFIDVDRFKKLNDTFGHQFGDMVLKRVAKAIGEVVRGADILARYGGEEFVILVHQPTEKGIAKFAERIRTRIEAEDIQYESQRVPVTASVGAAMTVLRRDELNAGTVLTEAADQAMYEAKEGGRNQIRVRVLMPELDRRLTQLAMQRRFSRWLVMKGVVDIEDVSKALLLCPQEDRRLGDLAQSQNLLNGEQVQQILTIQKEGNHRFGEAALAAGLLTEFQLAELLALQQENPRAVAAALIKVGAVDPGEAGILLRQFAAERADLRATPHLVET